MCVRRLIFLSHYSNQEGLPGSTLKCASKWGPWWCWLGQSSTSGYKRLQKWRPYWLWPAWELYDTIWWDLAGGQMAETASDDEGYNKDWDLSIQCTRQVKQQKWETNWHHSAQNLQKQVNEWMWLNSTSNRRVGGLLWTWEWTAHRHTEGVAFMVRKSVAKALIGWVPVSPKITASSLHDSTPRTERSPSLHVTAMLQPIHLHFTLY